jgi:predicted nucleic acid-binding protein
MTKDYVIDAHAWVEYLIGSKTGAKVKAILEEGNTGIYTNAVTLAEIISKVAREGKDIETTYKILTTNSDIIDADEELSKQAGIIHAQMRKTIKDFGLADAYVLATAKKLKTKILSGDPHFQNIKQAILITKP